MAEGADAVAPAVLGVVVVLVAGVAGGHTRPIHDLDQGGVDVAVLLVADGTLSLAASRGVDNRDTNVQNLEIKSSIYGAGVGVERRGLLQVPD